MKVQSKFFRNVIHPEDYENVESSALLPDRVPSIYKIAQQFISGRPIDASLNRNLGFNDIEDNPMLAKGLDLADVPDIARRVKMTLDDAVDEIQQSKVSKGTTSQVQDPSSQAPEKVESKVSKGTASQVQDPSSQASEKVAS